jgi:hypothetical protein
VSSAEDVPYVYKRTGVRVVKQEVEIGAMNDNEVVIVRGVEVGDQVLLVPPADAATMTAQRLPGSTRGTKSDTTAGPTDTATPARTVPRGT